MRLTRIHVVVFLEGGGTYQSDAKRIEMHRHGEHQLCINLGESIYRVCQSENISPHSLDSSQAMVRSVPEHSSFRVGSRRFENLVGLS
jgi:hypothetical protein